MMPMTSTTHPASCRDPNLFPATEETLLSQQEQASYRDSYLLRDVASTEASDSTARPLLSHSESSDEEKNFPGARHKATPSSSWWFLIRLSVLILTVGALASIFFSLAPSKANHGTQDPHEENTDPHGGSPHGGSPHHDSSQPHDQLQVSDHLQYHEDLPAQPELRSLSDYELPSTWNFTSPTTTREYFWTIRDGVLNPDGVFRPMMLINNLFPGPLVECNEGDRIIVHVENRAANATSIHFHGLYQNGTNDMDGSVGITQCAIAPGSTFTYNFTVQAQSGTYWYHAHHSVQASDGLLGPLVVHARDERTTLQEMEYDTDRVIMVQDHYHNTTAELIMDYLRPRSENDEPVPDNALINGRGRRDCSRDFPGWPCDAADRSPPEFHLAPGRRHRLRFINVGAYAEFQIEIDEHPFYVTEVDGTDVHPEPFHRLNILPAQRYSVIVETNGTSADGGAYWLRTRMVTHCFTTENPRLEPELHAVLRYVPPSSGTHPSTEAPSSRPWSEAIEVICRDLNTSALHPVVAMNPPPADAFISLRANFMIGDWKLSRGFFNGSTWHANMTHPSLHRLLDAANVTSTTASSSVVSTNTNPFDATNDFVIQTTTGVRTIDIAINSFDDGAHPFHLHGHKFFVLGQAKAGYPPSAEDLPGYLSRNNLLENPLRRDVVTVDGYAWTLVRVTLDNPGLWALHCHNAWHAAAGMVMQVLVRRDDVLHAAKVSEEHRRMCRLHGVELGDRPDDSIWFGDFS